MRLALVLLPFFLLLAALLAWPTLDLAVTTVFYTPEKGFEATTLWPFQTLHGIAYYGARVFGVALVLGLLAAWKKPFLALPRKAWFFLFLCLVIGPGLVANVIFKDHWGRARPHQIAEFGGTGSFSPPLQMSAACQTNCSFVSGDGAFGFFLPSLAYVIAPRRSRRVFWSGMVLGAVFGTARIAMGAHFLSDVLFAALFMLLTSALLHALLYGPRRTFEIWKRW